MIELNNYHSDRLLFRELRLSDAERLFAIYSDKEAMKYRGSQPMQSNEDALQFIAKQRLLENDTLTIRKGVEWKASNELVGTVMYKFKDHSKTECEIGYSIGRSFWGQGIGREIIGAMVEHLKELKTISTLIAWSRAENIASLKILEQNDFERIKQEEHIDCFLYRKSLY